MGHPVCLQIEAGENWKSLSVDIIWIYSGTYAGPCIDWRSQQHSTKYRKGKHVFCCPCRGGFLHYSKHSTNTSRQIECQVLILMLTNYSIDLIVKVVPLGKGKWTVFTFTEHLTQFIKWNGARCAAPFLVVWYCESLKLFDTRRFETWKLLNS